MAKKRRPNVDPTAASTSEEIVRRIVQRKNHFFDLGVSPTNPQRASICQFVPPYLLFSLPGSQYGENGPQSPLALTVLDGAHVETE